MKETIYTIPLTEALEKECECVLCFLEERQENEQVEYALGPAMMEPDYRILSNEKGFCRRHTQMLSQKKQALPFALILETRCDAVINKLENDRPKGKKKRFFSKKESGYKALLKTTEALFDTCLVCERIEHTMNQFLNTFWYLYEKEKDFKEKVLLGKGFCLRHFAKLLKAMEHLPDKKRELFQGELYALEIKALKKAKADVSGFAKQFDYRSDKENMQGPKDAHFLCAARLSGSFKRD